MSTFTEKILTSGQLPDTKGTLFTATVPTTITRMTCVNTNTTTEVGTIYVKPDADSMAICPFSLEERETKIVAGGKMPSILLEAGDLLEGETTTAAFVDYVVWGIEKT